MSSAPFCAHLSISLYIRYRICYCSRGYSHFAIVSLYLSRFCYRFDPVSLSFRYRRPPGGVFSFYGFGAIRFRYRRPPGGVFSFYGFGAIRFRYRFAIVALRAVSFLFMGLGIILWYFFSLFLYLFLFLWIRGDPVFLSLFFLFLLL